MLSKINKQKAIYGSSAVLVFLLMFSLKMRNSRKRNNREREQASKRSSRHKAKVDVLFFKNLFRLIKMCFFKNGIPMQFLAFNFILVLRTILTIYLTGVKAKIVKSIVSQNQSSFFKNMGNLAIVALPGSFFNSSLIYLQGKIALNMRKALVKKFNQKYA